MQNSVIEFLSRNKKHLIIISLIAIAVFFTYKKLHKIIIDPKSSSTQQDSTYNYNEGVTKTDTLEKYGFIANENYVIAEVADVRRTPNYAPYNTVHKIKFGTKIYTKNVDKENPNNIDIDESLLERESKNDYVAVYAQKPITLGDIPVGFLSKKDFIEKSEFKNFVPEPKKPEIPKTAELDSGIKATIDEFSFIDNNQYKLATDAAKIPKSIVYGDFNDDTIRDFAIILENEENSKYGLFIYINNVETNIYDLVYKKSFDSTLTIKTIKENSSVTVNSENTTFPLDGVLISKSDGTTYFHIYNTDDEKMMVLSN